MTQLKHAVEPFGEVNVYPTAGDKTRVVATVLTPVATPGQTSHWLSPSMLRTSPRYCAHHTYST